MNRGFSALFSAAAIGASPMSSADLPVFADVTKEAGIKFVHSIGDRRMDNIVEATGSGICFFDYNNDGYDDIYFVNGTWTKGVSDNESRNLRGKLRNALYRNNGDGTFTDLTEAAGVGGNGVYGTGCSAADYNNDGFVDLYVLNYGRNTLYRNNGDGTFTDVSRKSNLDDGRWSVHAVWFDAYGDGRLDVYVANYLHYDDGRFRDFYPAAGFPGPLSYTAEPDAFFRNMGDGTFKDMTEEAGLKVRPGRAMSVTAADVNNDGLVDVYVANDATENYYFEATRPGTFEERGIPRGVAFGEHGQGVASMGPVFSDVNRDGLLDLYIPDLRYNALLIQGPQIFEDRTAVAKLAMMMAQNAGWGSVLFDYDHDGWPDVFTVHGHAHHLFVQEDTLARNLGDGTFEDVSNRSGPFFLEKYVGRAAAYSDFDRDGDVDIVIGNQNDRPVLLRNDGGNSRNWLQVEVKLRFSTGTRDALGARVTVTAGGLRQLDDLIPSRGYLSQGQSRVHFGLGKADKADTVEVRWPDGSVEERNDVAANQFLLFEKEARTKGGRQ